MENISDEVLAVFDTTAQPDQIIKDTGSFSLFPWDTSVSHAAGNLTQALYTSKRFGKSKNVSLLTESLSGFGTTLDSEADHTATHTVSVLFDSNVSLRVGVEARIVDGNYLRRRFQGSSDGGGILSCGPGTKMESLQASVCKPAVKGGRNCADGVLEEEETRVDDIIVEGGNTHDNIGVAIDVFRDRVDDDIGAVLQRVLNVRTHESVINNNFDTIRMGNFADGTNIYQCQSRIRGSLDPDELGLGSDNLVEVNLEAAGECDGDAMGGGDLSEVAVGATVNITHGDYMGTRS